MAELTGEVFKNANVGDIVTHKKHKYLIVFKDTTFAKEFVIKHVPGKSEGEPLPKPHHRTAQQLRHGEKDIIVNNYYSNSTIRKKIDDGRFYKMIVVSDLGNAYTIEFPFELKASHGDLWSIYVAEFNKWAERSSSYVDSGKAAEEAVKAIADVLVVKPLKPTSKKAGDQHIIHWVDQVAKRIISTSQRDKKIEEIIAMMKDPKAAEDIRYQFDTRKQIENNTYRDHGFTFVKHPSSTAK